VFLKRDVLELEHGLRLREVRAEDLEYEYLPIYPTPFRRGIVVPKSVLEIEKRAKNEVELHEKIGRVLNVL